MLALCTETFMKCIAFKTVSLLFISLLGEGHVPANMAIFLIKLDSMLLKADSLQSQSFIAGYSCACLVYK